MRRWLVLVALLFFTLSGSAGDAPGPLTPGSDLPGSFHPYNVTEALPATDEAAEPTDQTPQKHRVQAHSTKGKFHSLVSEYDLEPVVMLIARGNLDDNASFGKLLQALDAAIARNRKAGRLHAFVVFVYDDLTDVLEQDDKREQYARKLEKLAEDLKLRSVVLTLASKNDLARYRPGDDALTAVLYRKLKIASTHKAGPDKIDDAAKAILADVSAKLGAVR